MKYALSRKNMWNLLGPVGRALVGPMVSRIPLPLLLGRPFAKTTRFLEKAQWWSTEVARDYQLAQLKRICKIAYCKTRFYRELFDSVGFVPNDLRAPEDIYSIPTIDRDTVQTRLHDMCAVSPWMPHVDYLSTGGTSGKPLRFYAPASRSKAEFAYLCAMWKRTGYEVGMPLAVFRGRVISRQHDGVWHEYDPILRHHFYSSFHMSMEDIKNYIENIRSIGRCYLHAYPSTAAVLARYIKNEKIEPLQNVVGVLAESENVYEPERALVEKVFGCRMFTSYGHSEKLVCGGECERSRAYHLWPTYGFTELLDTRGAHVAAKGERGEIVGTGFLNHVVPFIRYRTGDYASYAGDKCSDCGRQGILIAEVRGHNVQEVLVAQDGSQIPWAAVNVHDDTFDGVLQFQFWQKEPGRAVVKVVMGPGFDALTPKRILRRLSARLSGRLELEIRVVEEISSSKSGKGVFVDQNIPGHGHLIG